MRAYYVKLLKTLDCPLQPTIDNESITAAELVMLVSWLEDCVIRELEIEERDNLRHDGPQWNDQFRLYLDVLECPYEWPDEADDVLYWLLSLAIRIQFETQQSAMQEVAPSDYAFMAEGINLIGSIVHLERKVNELDLGIFMLFFFRS